MLGLNEKNINPECDEEYIQQPWKTIPGMNLNESNGRSYSYLWVINLPVPEMMIIFTEYLFPDITIRKFERFTW